MLSGDVRGNRILKGAELARAGFAPAVLVSNGRCDYDQGEADLAINFAVGRGYPRELFIGTKWRVQSTVEEARSAAAELRSRGVRRAIIVTTTWHTARAARIYRRIAPDLTFYMVGAEDPFWRDGKWWIDRQGRKTFFMESLRTIADFLGI